MELVKLSTKGQLVIPQKLREELGMQEGTIVALERADNSLILQKVDETLLHKIKKGFEDIKHGRIKEWKS